MPQQIKSGQDVTDLMNDVKSGDDVTSLMNQPTVQDQTLFTNPLNKPLPQGPVNRPSDSQIEAGQPQDIFSRSVRGITENIPDFLSGLGWDPTSILPESTAGRIGAGIAGIGAGFGAIKGVQALRNKLKPAAVEGIKIAEELLPKAREKFRVVGDTATNLRTGEVRTGAAPIKSGNIQDAIKQELRNNLEQPILNRPFDPTAANRENLEFSPSVKPQFGSTNRSKAEIDALLGGKVDNQRARLPRDLKGAKPRYSIGQNQYIPEFESDIDKALFILAQKNPSKREADYLKFVIDNTGLDEKGVRDLSKTVKEGIKNQLKGKEPGTVKIGSIYKEKGTGNAAIIGKGSSIKPRISITGSTDKPDAIITDPHIDHIVKTFNLDPNEVNDSLGGIFDPHLASKGNSIIPPNKPPNQPPIIPPNKPPDIPPDIPLTPDQQFKKQLEDEGLIFNAFRIMKGLKATGDLGPILRQGIAYTGRPAWRKAAVQQFKSFANEASSLNFRKALESDRLLVKNPQGVSWADEMGLDIPTVGKLNEEGQVGLDQIEKLWGIGKLAKRSNRAFADTIAQLRVGVANTLYDNYDRVYQSMRKTAKTAEEIAEAENWNPKSPMVGKLIADDVNTASGRGSLKIKETRFGKHVINPEINAEPAGEILNLTLFSPRLFSARMKTLNRTLNPLSYYKQDPVMRKEHLKQLLSIAGAITASDGLYSLFGGKPGMEPRSSDFGKSRFENTTVDTSGGIAKIPTLASRVATNSLVSSKGREYELGKGIVGDATSLVEDFGEGMASPVARLAMDLLNRKEFGGKPTQFTSMNPFENTFVKDTVMPMIIQDTYELIKEDPSLIPLLFPAALGQSINVYNPNTRKK